MSDGRLRIVGGTLLTPSIEFPATLWIENGKIVGIGDETPREGDWPTLDVAGLYVAPGFIDVHVHGGAGADFMDGSPEDAITIARYHAAGGTTSLLATTATDSLENIRDALEAVAEARGRRFDGARLLGVHLEGPYFNFEKKGCHLAEYVRNPTSEETAELLEYADLVRWITLAPELPGAEEAIRAFAERGIIVSAGHSNATYSELVDAIDWGLRHSTHLYCAMSGVVKDPPKRYGGIVETSLLLDEMTTEIIADGVHLPPELMRLAFKCKGVEGLILVTDAQRAAGMPDGEYEFGKKGAGAPFIVQNGVAMAPDRSGYASSTVQMIETVRVAHEIVGASLTDAVTMASQTPARILGIDETTGSLDIGKDADLVLFDEGWCVHRTFVAGREVYRRD